MFSVTGNLIAVGEIALLWYSLPLVIAISLVYGATRHEHLREIVVHCVKAAFWLAAFMLVVFVLVWWMSWGL